MSYCRVDLTTSVTSDLELGYRILDDQGNVVANEAHSAGPRETVNLSSLNGLPGAGTYYVVIEDDGFGRGKCDRGL